MKVWRVSVSKATLASRSELPTEAVAIGQSEIQDQGGILRRSEYGTRVINPAQHISRKARRLQALGEQLRKLFIIFDNEQSHALIPFG